MYLEIHRNTQIKEARRIPFLTEHAALSAGPTAVSLRRRFAEHTSLVAVTALVAPILRSGEIPFCLYLCLENFRNWLSALPTYSKRTSLKQTCGHLLSKSHV